MRRLIFVGILAVVLLGSFFLTLWLTDISPQDTRSHTEQLADRKVSDYSDLSRVAWDIGLTLSRRIRGVFEGATRSNERDVRYWGWLADPDGDATPLNIARCGGGRPSPPGAPTPLTIVVFAAGRAVPTAQTKGERADVTGSLGLAFGAEK